MSLAARVYRYPRTGHEDGWRWQRETGDLVQSPQPSYSSVAARRLRYRLKRRWRGRWWCSLPTLKPHLHWRSGRLYDGATNVPRTSPEGQ